MNWKIKIVSDYQDFVDILAVLKFLIDEENVDVNVKANDGKTVLHYATKNSTLEIVKYLVDKMNPGDNFIKMYPYSYIWGKSTHPMLATKVTMLEIQLAQCK